MKPEDFEEGTAERTFAEVIEAWHAQDLSRLVELSQPSRITWRREAAQRQIEKLKAWIRTHGRKPLPESGQDPLEALRIFSKQVKDGAFEPEAEIGALLDARPLEGDVAILETNQVNTTEPVRFEGLDIHAMADGKPLKVMMVKEGGRWWWNPNSAPRN